MLNDASVPTAAKEKSLIELLVAACEIQFTPLGLKLLWMGYHNLKPDRTRRPPPGGEEGPGGVPPLGFILINSTMTPRGIQKRG